MNRQKGFTLIELMVVVAIAAILVAIAGPSFSSSLRTSRIESSKDMLLNSVRLAKREAMSRSNSVAVCASANLESCDSGLGSTHQWGNGWIVFVDVDRNGEVDGNTDVILGKFKPDKGVGIYVQNGGTSTASSNYLRFTASGRALGANLTGASAARTFCIVDSRFSSGNTKYFRRVILDESGYINDVTQMDEMSAFERSDSPTVNGIFCATPVDTGVADATSQICLGSGGKKCLEDLIL